MHTRIRMLAVVAVVAAALVASIAAAAHSPEPGTSATGKLVSIQQVACGNVFMRPATPAFRLKLAGGARSVLWTATDYWGSVAASGSLAPHAGTVDLAFDPKALGHFRLEVEARHAGGRSERVATTFACLSHFDVRSIPDSPFGVCTHFGQWWPLEIIDLIAKAGIKEVRDEVYWGGFEKSRGRYALERKTRSFLEALDGAGIRTLVPLTYGNDLYENGLSPHTPAMFDAYANYAAAIARLAPSLVDAVEVWNEWNSPGFCKGPADSRPDVYLEMEKAAYRKVKRVNPSIPVAGCSTTGLWWGGYRWLEKYFELPGSLTNMDTLAVHPYNCALEPEYLQESMQKLQGMMTKAQGRTVPIWVTEIGWSMNLPSGKQPAPGFEYMSDNITTEAQQALYIVRTYAVLLANGVEKVHWYDFMNDGTNVHEGEQNFGLIRHPGDALGRFVPKSGYAALATMARALSAARFVRNESDDPLVWSLVFDRKGEHVRLAWTLAPSIVRVRSRRPVEVRDLMGNPVACERRADGLRVVAPVGEPFYVFGDAERVDAPLLVRVPDTVRNAAGEAAVIPVEVTNRFTEDIAFRLTVGDEVLPMIAPASHEGPLEGVLPSRDDEATDRAPLTVTIADRVVLKQPVALAYKPQCVLAVKPYFAGRDRITFRVGNASLRNTLTLTSVDWTIDGRSGSCPVRVVVAPEGEADVSVRGVSSAGALRTVDARVTAKSNDGSWGWDVRITDAPCSRARIRVDASLADWRRVPFVDLEREGAVQQMKGYRGAADLSGRIAIAHDRRHLFIAAEIVDDTHHQPFDKEKVWMGDSLQFALSERQPWNSEARYELSAALTPVGPELFAHETARGEKRGIAGTAAIKRTGNRTVYELTIPLSRLKLFDGTADGMFGFSLLVNDNDGKGRRGWIEWGSGIGFSKNPKQYHACRLVK